MKITPNNPPNIELIKSFLQVPTHAIFCYGDTIYNPSKRELTPDVIHHESIHSKQQGDNPDNWYFKYLQDPQFRLEQELEAYGEQYILAKQAFEENNAPSKYLDWALENMATALSKDYGIIITQQEAKSKIRNYAKNSQKSQ